MAYDGTDYYGWQSQENGNTIQDLLERRLTVIFNQQIRIHGSGRTDSGVHAKAQVFHFDGDWALSSERLLSALRAGLPETINVFSAKRVSDSFHARYSAKGKRYIYHLYEGFAPPPEVRFYWSLGARKLNLSLMHAAAESLLGKYDFTSFAAEREDAEDNPVKDLRRLDIVKRGSRVHITTEADGYLYKMVRSLTGALVDAGRGKLTPQNLVDLRDKHQRTKEVVTAPAKGLSLDKVFY